MEREFFSEERVCVTGAGGYIASWAVKLLLSKAYVVQGTVRDPCDEKKNGHLKKLEKASENLHLFKADLFDYEGLYTAIAGCARVLHVASPVPSENPSTDPEAEMVEPAITGTRNVLNACLKAKVNKVVVVSSVAAVMLNPNWPKDQPMDENSWSDTEFCKSTEIWYPIGKAVAEREALEFGMRNELNIVTICPSLVIGPKLQSTLNVGCSLLLSYLKGEINAMNSRVQLLVDVRDFAEALLLLYEKPEANGRYICSSYTIRPQALVEELKAMYPNYNYPKIFTEEEGSQFDFNCKKLQDFGWMYRPLEESIADAMKNFEESGLLVGT